nr:hypothetical protein [Thiorhodococcus minor]
MRGGIINCSALLGQRFEGFLDPLAKRSHLGGVQAGLLRTIHNVQRLPRTLGDQQSLGKRQPIISDLWIKIERPLQMIQPGIDLSALHLDDAKIVVGFGMVGIKRQNGAIKPLGGLRATATLMLDGLLE